MEHHKHENWKKKFKYLKFKVIQKTLFHQYKSPISINNIDINQIVVSNKVSSCKKSFKYFIGYKEGKKFRPLCLMLSKMSAYGRDFDETIYMSFLIKKWWIPKVI